MELLYIVILKIQKILAYIENSFLRKIDDKKSIYEIKDSYRNNHGQQIIVAKITNLPRSVFKIRVMDLVLKNKDILSGFSVDDIVNIVGLAAVEKEPFIVGKRSTAYKYYAPLAMLFGSVLTTANIASSKLISFFGETMTGGTFVYPLAYVLGDIVTEVYGYKRARQLIWGSILCSIIFVFFLQLIIAAPPSIYWHNQSEYALILGAVPRIIFASLIAHWVGEFLNSYIIAKFKIAYNGQNLLGRIVSSSLVGITTNTLIFVFIGYVGVIPFSEMLPFSTRICVVKLLCQFFSIPITMWMINRLKTIEQLDIFDINTDFTPFSLDITYSDINNKLAGEHLEEDEEQRPITHLSNLVK